MTTARKILTLKGRKKIIPATKAPIAMTPKVISADSSFRKEPKPKAAPKPDLAKREEIKANRRAKLKKARNWLREFEVIKNNVPLAVGIDKEFLKVRPEGMACKYVKAALSEHVRGRAYRAGVVGKEATCIRYQLNGEQWERPVAPCTN